MAVMDREKWLEERRKGIGGSDAAALVGMNSYSTPYTVWADKTGRLPEKEDSEAMRQGRDLEQYVAERFMEWVNDNIGTNVGTTINGVDFILSVGNQGPILEIKADGRDEYLQQQLS